MVASGSGLSEACLLVVFPERRPGASTRLHSCEGSLGDTSALVTQANSSLQLTGKQNTKVGVLTGWPED